MMLKEVLLLVLVGWMVMPAHPWKPPEHGYGNDDTSDKLDRPSPQDTQKNIRDHRNYIHHRYGDNNPTGPEIFRQLRHNTGKDQPKKSAREKFANLFKWKSGKANPMNSAWDTCKEIAKKSVWEKLKQKLKWKNSKKTASSKVRPKRSPKVTKRYLRAFGNYTYHGQNYKDPAGIRLQLRGRTFERDTRVGGPPPPPPPPKSPPATISGSIKKEVLYLQQELKDLSFERFKRTFNKTYEFKGEENGAYTNFKKNVKEIANHNELYYIGITSYMKQVSWWSDSSEEIFKKSGGCVKENNEPARRPKKTVRTYISEDVGKEPESIDYRQCEAMNPIRHQGTSCGACWAFSATSSIESQIFLIYGKLPELSEQYLIDCGPYRPKENVSSGGCYGGDPKKAIEFVMEKGIALRDNYPYTGNYEDKCKEDVLGNKLPKTNYKVSSMLQIKKANDADLLNALVHKGPISVIIYQSWNFVHYKEGVINDELCEESSEVNHAMVLVGYGTEELQNQKPRDYWLLRNSYGEEMGDKGYFKLARDTKNHCKIADYAVIPLIK